LVNLSEKLRKKIKAKHVFITLGHEGLLIHTKTKKTVSWENDLIPAMNSFPVDTAGGGDALLVVSSMALATKCSIWDAAYLGSVAAACQVDRIGNMPLKIDEIMDEVNKQLK